MHTDFVGTIYFKHYNRRDRQHSENFDAHHQSYACAPQFYGRWQNGEGFSDILRNIASFMLPVLFRGAKKFATHTLKANEQGMSLGEAAQEAIKPALSAAAKTAARRFQGGSGKRRRKTQKGEGSKRVQKVRGKSKSKSSNKLQSGKGARRKKRVYKRKQAIGLPTNVIETNF